MSPTATLVRRAGRPRDDTVEQRVISAAVALLLEADRPDEITIAGIVQHSGVSRAALYRRWSSREELLAAALDSARSEVVIPDTGDLLADLISGFSTNPDATAPDQSTLIRKRLILALQNPQLRDVYWQRHVSRRRIATLAALRGGVEKGLVRADADLEVVVDLISGIAYYQMVVRGETFGPQAQERIREGIRTVWRGIAT